MAVSNASRYHDITVNFQEWQIPARTYFTISIIEKHTPKTRHTESLPHPNSDTIPSSLQGNTQVTYRNGMPMPELSTDKHEETTSAHIIVSAVSRISEMMPRDWPKKISHARLRPEPKNHQNSHPATIIRQAHTILNTTKLG